MDDDILMSLKAFKGSAFNLDRFCGRLGLSLRGVLVNSYKACADTFRNLNIRDLKLK